MTSQPDKANEIYERCLFPNARGFPLWIPESNRQLPIEYRRIGVSIGDVGIIRSDGGFSCLFNICQRQDHHSNRWGVPDGFKPIELGPSNVVEILDTTRLGYFASPTIKRVNSTTRSATAIRFSTSAEEGAVLVTPEGYIAKNLQDGADPFTPYVKANVENWYRFVVGTLGIRVKHLRLVVGCDKTAAYGVAANRSSKTHGHQGTSFLQFQTDNGTQSSQGLSTPTSYYWSSVGIAEYRAGSEPLNAAIGEDQRWPLCTFLRTWTIALNEEDFAAIEHKIAGKQQNELRSNSSTSQSTNKNVERSSASNSSESAKIIRTTERSPGENSEEILLSAGGTITLTKPTAAIAYHPADSINQRLLEEASNHCRLAIAHDADWCSVLNEDDAVMPPPNELIKRVFAAHHIREKDRIVYLEPTEEHSLRLKNMQNEFRLKTIAAEKDTAQSSSFVKRNAEGVVLESVGQIPAAHSTDGTKMVKPNLYALLIGINNYSGSRKDMMETSDTSNSSDPGAGATSLSNLPVFSNLRAAVSDAKKFRDYLINTVELEASHISLLLDEEATRENIIEAFQRLAHDPEIKEGDSIFIFYAGHSTQALPPQSMLGLPGCPEYVELLVPYNSTNCRSMIPDYTLAALLDEISKKKGNNITLAFDCSYSFSITRKRPALISSRDPDSEEIVRTGPELHHRVPDDLDEKIWRGNRMLSTALTASQNASSSSYVLFSACKSSECAREISGEGLFTKALLKLLNNLGPSKISCSQIAERLQTQIKGQSPQCEGLYSESRPFFQSYTSPHHEKNVFNLTTDGDSFTLNGGKFHGFCTGDELLVYKSKLKDRQETSIVTVVITEALSNTSYLMPVSGSTFSLKDHPNAVAVFSKTTKLYLKVHVDWKETTLLQRISTLGLCIITGVLSDAHISISLSLQSEKPIRIDIVDKDVLGLKDVKDSLKPWFLDDKDEVLAHVIGGLSHYYYHLKRTSDSLEGLIDKITVSFFQVQETLTGHPRIVKVHGAENLCRNNIIDIDVTANLESDPIMYGLEIINNSSDHGILYLYLFYFDNTDFTISQYPFILAEDAKFSWPAKLEGQALTIGYGTGAGSNVHPFSFCVRDGYTMETGFIKLFLFEKPVNVQDIIQVEPVFTSIRRMKRVADLSEATSSHRWGSITLTVIQREEVGLPHFKKQSSPLVIAHD